ncbi:M48 family metalloprotease [Neptunitalea lumnitzerae]|uniref:Secreted protein n=1 Tax=Neptunitalea lumnitzerae TaxID=2965509 RepID=A0ABQ5MEB1_9FLAO|nr:hypothetical protein [Neptunitalea sp. Y10]GLB47716.1 hypothetical protein Y10_00840 [Neptunitalea sp. Y10]
MNHKTINNKKIPETILEEALIALSHYPELKDVSIEFRFKKNIKKSFMQAQPKFSSLLSSRRKRKYFIFMNTRLHIDGEDITVTDVPKEVLVGWLGHELGHVMDYLNRNTWNLIVFGLKYIFIGKHIQEAERAADTFAIQHGMVNYILATKNFILNHANISPEYKARIKRLYLSPEDIMQLVNES